jgi:hypothetical protein
MQTNVCGFYPKKLRYFENILKCKDSDNLFHSFYKEFNTLLVTNDVSM